MDASCSSKYWDCVGSELQAEEDPNLRELSQQTYYGSAPEDLWSELAEPEEDPGASLVPETDKDEYQRLLHLLELASIDPAGSLVQETDEYEHEMLRDLLELTSIDPSQLEIVESIAEGGQAHVSLAQWWPSKYPRFLPGREVVVKRYKGRLGVLTVLALRRRIEDMESKGYHVGLCRLIGLSEDNITGEVSLVTEAHRGDLRNLIDKRMDYLKSRMSCSNMQDDDATQMMMMPFPYSLTVHMMLYIASGMEDLCENGIIHRDLKASNIFVDPVDLHKNGYLEVRNSREVELKEDLGYYCFDAYVGDYESSDGVVGTGFWRPPEVLKAVKEDIRPTYTTAADVYGFGMVCYELLTGHIPFQCEGVQRTDYDAVLSGRRPKLPDYLSPGMTVLLLECWHHDPCQRPTWSEIRDILSIERSLLGQEVIPIPWM